MKSKLKDISKLVKEIKSIPSAHSSILMQKQMQLNAEIAKTFEEMHERLDKVEETLNQHGCQCDDDFTRRAFSMS